MKVTSKGVRRRKEQKINFLSLSVKRSGAESLAAAKEVRARERKHQKIPSPPLIYAKLK
jgi:hypothetical protein